MRLSKQWLPAIVGLLLTPFTMLAALYSSAVGHGNYFWAIVFYPYTMLSTFVFQSITIPFILLAVLQYPIYGVLAGYGWIKGKGLRYGLGLLLVHVSALVLCFGLGDKNF